MNQEITGHTRLICLLGSPVGHSKSPMMHNEAFRALGLDYAYLAFDVKEEQLEKAIEGLKIFGARGMNLTMPLKNKIVPLCDHLSPAAQLCQAVNTVVIEDDHTLTGHTTDGAGFFMSCREEGVEIKGKKMTLLGAGGAGTAILVQAALDGAEEIALFSRSSSPFIQRTMETVEKLKEKTPCRITLYDYQDDVLKQQMKDSRLLVNATNIGMAPEEDACLIPDASFFHPGLAVADVIYNPLETKLVKMAKEAGCKAFGGLNMLLYQGAEAFRLWTGQTMPVERVREKNF